MMILQRVFIIAIVILLAAACTPANPPRTGTAPPARTLIITTPSETTSTEPVSTDLSVIRTSTKPVATPRPMIVTPQPTPTEDLLACLPDDPGYTGTVSWVIDGETIVMDIAGRRETVRLLGIDAVPLTAETTRSLLDRRVVRLVSDGTSVDAYGRFLRYVLYLDGRFINDELLRSGAARLDVEAAGLSCGGQFASAEDFALQEGLGLWGISAVAALPTEQQATGSAGPPVGSAVPSSTPSTTPSLTPASSTTITPATPRAPTNTQTIPTNTLPPTITPGSPGGVNPTRTATRPAPTGTVVGTGVQIVHIFYDGTLDPYEADEYIEIKNFENTAVDLLDWWIFSDTEAQFFFFPEFSLAAGESCRIYTNQVQADSCLDDSFRSYLEVWSNIADCGYLYDWDYNERSSFCYGEVP